MANLPAILLIAGYPASNILSHPASATCMHNLGRLPVYRERLMTVGRGDQSQLRFRVKSYTFISITPWLVVDSFSGSFEFSFKGEVDIGYTLIWCNMFLWSIVASNMVLY